MTQKYTFDDPDEEDTKLTGGKEFSLEISIGLQVNRILYMVTQGMRFRPNLRVLEDAIMFFEATLKPYWTSSNPLTLKKKKKESPYETERKRILADRKTIDIYKDKIEYFRNLSDHFSLIMFLVDQFNLGLKRVIHDST